jgi:hypothetical protein
MTHFTRLYFTWELSHISSAVFSRKFPTFSFISSSFKENSAQINHILYNFCNYGAKIKDICVILQAKET